MCVCVGVGGGGGGGWGNLFLVSICLPLTVHV